MYKFATALGLSCAFSLLWILILVPEPQPAPESWVMESQREINARDARIRELEGAIATINSKLPTMEYSHYELNRTVGLKFKQIDSKIEKIEFELLPWEKVEQRPSLRGNP